MVARRQERSERSAGGAAPGAIAAVENWSSRAFDAYSRRVVFLRRVLPALGLGLLLLVAAWPRLRPLLDSVRLAYPIVDRRDARELRMVNPRYAGIDRLNRPYILTAAAGAQMPGHNDLVSLDRPRGQIIAHGGAKVVLTAATGVYQAQSRLLDLFGDVTLTHANGTRFVTQAAHLDLAGETADGHDPIAGRGPSGAITAQGFRIKDKGDTILFTGHSHLLLLRIGGQRPAPPPRVLPAKVETKAAVLSAAALDARHQGTVAASPATGAGRSGAPPAASPPGAVSASARDDGD